ncbi:MAG: hypothetical protein V4659_00120 [Pseudomonadota bacterium]
MTPDEEARLARYARERGRPKSALAREWIVQRLQRDDIDEQVRVSAEVNARAETPEMRRAALAASDAFSRYLDTLDGGYDWGPDGPPPFR